MFVSGYILLLVCTHLYLVHVIFNCTLIFYMINNMYQTSHALYSFTIYFLKICHGGRGVYYGFLKMTEVNNNTLITKTDQTGKRECRKNFFFFQKRQNNCEKLNTRFHAKITGRHFEKSILHPWEI